VSGGDAPLLLCSGSPRRRDLLRAARIAFEPGPGPDVDETPPPGADAPTAAEALARRKAVAAAARAPGRLVLTADTVVALGDRLLGKPESPDDARAILRALSGRAHQVATGVALARDGAVRSAVDVATVTFRALGDAEVSDYVASGEGLDKAGGYAIQGRGRALVASLSGSEDTVVGLPVAVVRRLLEIGVPTGR
jgi:septum formation protein